MENKARKLAHFSNDTVNTICRSSILNMMYIMTIMDRVAEISIVSLLIVDLEKYSGY